MEVEKHKQIVESILKFVLEFTLLNPIISWTIGETLMLHLKEKYLVEYQKVILA